MKSGSSSGRSAAENSSESGTEERGDLITFYNAVYVGRVQSFALKYDITNQDHVVSKLFWSFALLNNQTQCGFPGTLSVFCIVIHLAWLQKL